MVVNKCEIVVNDVFNELKEENNRLINELLFADKCLKVLIEFKSFVELNSNQFKLNLEENNKQIYEDFSEKVKHVLDGKSYYSMKLNENNWIEMKKEINGSDGNDREVKTLKKKTKHKRRITDLNDPNNYRCEWSECQFVTISEESLSKHIKTHSQSKDKKTKKKYVCDRPDCHYWSDRIGNIRRHISGHEARTNPIVEQQNDLVCSYCDQRFQFESNLSLHLTSHLKSEVIPSDTTFTVANSKESNDTINEQIVCRYSNCGQRFDNKRDLKNHTQRHTRKVEIFVCKHPGCYNRFDRPSRLEEHMKRKHTEEKRFECKTCGKTYPNDYILQSHIKRIHILFDEPVVCGIDGCDKQFINDSKLKDHQKMCHLLRFVCDYPNCDYKTGNNDLLRKHKIVKHSTETPFKCQFDGCGKAFKLETHYKYHLKTHSTAVLTCPHEGCDKTYTNIGTMKKHIKYYHSDTWHTCEWPGCEYRTKNKSSLTSHMAKHGEYTIACIWPNCDKKFKTKANMKNHLLIHKQEKNQICPLPGCDYRCITASNLRIHMKNRHKDI